MPRRQFVADLAKAQNGTLPLGITDVRAGEDDGQIQLVFTGGPVTLPTGPVEITAIITPDLGDYPKSHDYMIFGGDEAPRYISAALEDVRGTARKTVVEVLNIISATLSKLSPDKDGDSQMQDSQFDVDFDEEDDDNADIYDSDHEAFDVPALTHNAVYAAQAPSSKQTRLPSSGRDFRQRIRSDLRAAKAAGFRVGVLGQLLDGFNAYVSISIRVAKLGISDEAMQAWHVESSDYLNLIIQYPNGYKTNEELQSYDGMRLTPNLGMRVVTGKSYKPTLQEAIKAFTVARKGDRLSTSSNGLPPPEAADTVESSVRDTFISKPLMSMLQERLVPILRYRSAGMPWMGAEDWYQHQASAGIAAGYADRVPDSFFEPEIISEALPRIVRGDHYATRGTTQFSFPLLAMEFTLRHFVRCTEFCLVCHRKLDTEVEAIKPYVCDNGLCLYQYMSLGFGPSIEHELVAQPYVVDLLTSFCYNSSAARKLREFPDGLSLTVPPVDSTAPVYEVGFDWAHLEMIFHGKPNECPVRRGAWIVLTTASIKGYDLHCRVADTTYYPTIKIDEPLTIRQLCYDPTVANAKQSPQTPAPTRPVSPESSTPCWAPASFQVYEQNFDDLDREGKCRSICRLLDTLPTVIEMREFLSMKQNTELRTWTERISPAVLSLLRWIIASNRACIMQVDGDVKVDNAETSDAAKAKPTVFGRDQGRCYGMKDYMQFRFAMGAPDKEQRFISEVRNTTARLKLQYPTLFAWHGSPLRNWHMIIREGLHYNNVDHGRTYGHGVYHAKEAMTSAGYCGMSVALAQGGTWPNSVLCISSALAMNEIVNAPNEFVSSHPFYVVQHLDWIQTRYLFVRVQPSSKSVQIGEDVKPRDAHPQDPTRTPRGTSDNIMIPAAAIKSSKTAHQVGSKTSLNSYRPCKKRKRTGTVASDAVIIDDDDEGDTSSIATDVEDITVLVDEDPEPDPRANATGREIPVVVGEDNVSKEDFVPGTLDFSTLPIMPLPTYASSATTKRLLKELQSLQKAQGATPLRELGWYIDVAKIENVYQWIVELHSFHTFEVKGKPLPLALDMKQENLKSIVLEIRFNKDFPFTPPYVRVLRPRFLSLAQGGGGHIVMGGAMCMELLTNSGWSSVSSMESVLMQIRMAIASEPFARLDKRGGRAGDYGTAEAADGYMRACQAHGWNIPPGFKEMAYGKALNGSG